MKCENIGKIDLYFEKKLNDQERAFITDHLETCNDCHGYLNELKRTDLVLAQLKSFKPELTNPVAFRNEVLGKINPKHEGAFQNILDRVVETIISILVKPATKYAIVACAMIFLGLFIYQQSMIVQKMDDLEKRMEAKVENPSTSSALSLETYFKRKDANVLGKKQTDNLLNDHRYLQLKYTILLKVLKERHPDTYREFMLKIEKESHLPTDKSNNHEEL